MAEPRPNTNYPRMVKRSKGWQVEYSPGNYSPQVFQTAAQGKYLITSYNNKQQRQESASTRTTSRRSGFYRDQKGLAGAYGRSNPSTVARGVATPGPSADAGQCIPPDRNDFQALDFAGKKTGQLDVAAYNAAVIDYQACLEGNGGAGGGGGGSGPTVVDYMSSVIDSINTEIDARRLRSDQAVQEFQRRMDAFRTSGDQFQGLQPYTIPGDAKYIPGLEPNGFGQSIGLGPVAASPISYNPFETAFKIVQQTPDITSIGAPDVSQIVQMAKGFLGQ